MNPQEQPNIPLEQVEMNPVDMAKKVLEIEKNLKEEISAIQEILAMVVANKIDLEKIKAMAKDKLTSLINE